MEITTNIHDSQIDFDYTKNVSPFAVSDSPILEKAKSAKLNYSTIPCIERKRFADEKKVKAFGDGLKILIYFFSKYLNIINR